MADHPRYGLVVTAHGMTIDGVSYATGEALPDSLETENPRMIQRSLDAGRLRRKILTGAQVAQAMGEREEAVTQVDVSKAARRGVRRSARILEPQA